MDRRLTAYVELIETNKRRDWRVIVCPFCGGTHVHGAGPLNGNLQDYLGDRVPHCTIDDVIGSKAYGDYELAEADHDLRLQLHRIAAITPRFLVASGDGHIYSRNRTAGPAMKAAERTPLRRQPVLILNPRLIALRSLQTVYEPKVEVPWPNTAADRAGLHSNARDDRGRVYESTR